eukprot:946251_1
MDCLSLDSSCPWCLSSFDRACSGFGWCLMCLVLRHEFGSAWWLSTVLLRLVLQGVSSPVYPLLYFLLFVVSFCVHDIPDVLSDAGTPKMDGNDGCVVLVDGFDGWSQKGYHTNTACPSP